MPFWLQETIGALSLLIVMASVLVLQLAVANDSELRRHEARNSDLLVASAEVQP